jgi:hypothetical protein
MFVLALLVLGAFAPAGRVSVRRPANASEAEASAWTSFASPVARSTPTYPAWFNESGILPSPGGWTVDIDPGNLSGTSSGPSILLNLANGSYSYFAMRGELFFPVPDSGTFAVAGHPQAVSLRLAPAFAANFAEIGLPPGMSWSLTLAGPPSALIAIPQEPAFGGGTLTIGVASGIVLTATLGNYTYWASSPGSATQTGVLNISEPTALTGNVSFPSSSSGPSLPTWVLPAAGILVVGVIAISLWTYRTRQRRESGPDRDQPR